MKKIFFALFAGIIPVAASLSGAYAQGSGSKFESIKLPPSTADENDVKTPPAIWNNVNTKAIKNFKKEFVKVTDEKWYEVKGGYIAKFILDDVQHRVDYDNKGRWLHTMKFYGEKKLPRHIRAMVKSTYYDHTINQVQEITFPSNLVYLIYIEDESGFKTIRIVDGDMDVMKEFNKK